MLRYPSQADVAQVVAHLIGNEEVTSPSLVISSFKGISYIEIPFLFVCDKMFLNTLNDG